MASLTRSDLDFVLKQILLAEAHAAGNNPVSLTPDAFAPLGLRTVDGSFNNLLPDQSQFGASDQRFQQLLPQFWRTAEDNPNIPGNVPTTYWASSGSVYDSQPRVISNLVADQSSNNPAATSAGAQLTTSPGRDGVFGTADDTQTYSIPNVAPDAGLSAPYNSWFTLFGQFFSHGLDLINKGGNGTVRILLAFDDPLYQRGADNIAGTADDLGADMVQGTFDDQFANFMTLTRASMVTDDNETPFDTTDDIHYHTNQTTPFVDQNQTYTSHPSHQVFLREYALNADGKPVATGRLYDGATGGLPTWAEVKAQAASKLGIQLDDGDILNIPLVRTDAYGKFIPGANGYAQLVTGLGADGIPNTADDVVVEGNPAANGGLGVSTAGALRINHAFLDDIAHNAVPGTVYDTDGNPATPGVSVVQADPDSEAGNTIETDFMGRKVEYDDELLDAHFITGDGRGNENIGLTAVHHIFHSEHNRQAAEIQSNLLADAIANNDPTFLNQWLITGVTAGEIPGDPAALQWDGERLFQAARFATEMQYQHLAFEEFARKVQPNIDAFLTPIGYDVAINPAITSEFANVVFRFGHSMLTETVDRYDADFNVVGNPNGLDPAGQQMGLIAAFLNPLAFNQDGMSAAEGAGAIVRGMTRQTGNEIDEFVTEAVRNNLVGLPLDLAAINITRGRDAGVPSLNDARQEFYRITQDAQLKPYESWTEFAANLKHEASVINFIAAYGTHASITSADTVAEKRAAAELLVLGGAGAPVDRLDFLNGDAATTGVAEIDFWIGGLAEKQMPFGGILGSTFAFVFETQLEALQNGDRFYYLARTAGLDFGVALENNSFASLIMLNTDATHLPGDVFTTPAYTLEVDRTKQFNANLVAPRDDPTGPDALIPLVIRDDAQTPQADTNYLRYTGEDHVVLGGTDNDDTIFSSIGDDTLYGDGGDDRLESGAGNDRVFGGAGDDIITDAGGDDIIHGDEGHDVIHGGNGLNLLFGDAGKDFIITGEDVTSAFAGAGNDFVLGSLLNLEIIGGAGDDWLEFGHQDGTFGDNADAVGNDSVKGHDVFVGGPGFEDLSGEGGDDIMFGSDGQEKMSGASGFDWANYKFDTAGVTVDMQLQIDDATPATPSAASLLDLFSFVEGLSGSAFSDVLRGTDARFVDLTLAGAQGSVLDAAGIARIAGLQELLGAGVTSFGGGNIILGGAGSDVIEGRGGNDVIDGDRWLNVRVSVRDANDHAVEIRTVDSIRELVPDLLSGAINPSQLEIVREIKTAAGPDYDTAMFSGARDNYSVSIAFDGTVTVTDNFGTRFTHDGTDVLRGIERLQFADIAIDLPGGPANAAPVGLLTISDTTPAIGQVLSALALGVTDADNVSATTNPTGAISNVTYYWQVERPGVGGAPGTYWEDIILQNGLGGGATPAQGPTLQLPELSDALPIEGARIRVRAVYQDENGVLENVFSAPTAAVSPATPVGAPAPLPPESPTQSKGVHFIRSDLEFILDQIVIAERHTTGADLLSLVGNERLPYGLRTVDGTFNNLVPGHDGFGASDNNFPLLLDQVFRNDLDGDALDTNGPAPGGVINNTNYATTGSTAGNVVDADPRIISNLIADQTAHNPAAVAAKEANPTGGLTMSPGLDGVFGTADDRPVFEIPNVKPDAGISAPFNSFMTLFGQFFDHGLDLLDKGGNGTVYIPLQADDPLIAGADGVFGNGDDLPESQRFMLLTRATNQAVQAGADGVFNTADDVHFHNNETTPFIDQNQTYTSHASHQAFLREYVRIGGETIDTGRLLEGSAGGLATWHDIKQQARDLLGIKLSDTDIFNVPLLATDAYGNLLLGANGYAQVVTNQGQMEGVAGGLDLATLPGGAIVARTNHAFLDDIAHNAVPGTVYDSDGDPTTPATIVQVDADSVAGNAIGTDNRGRKIAYDDELLDAHFITGDGRGNENIGLTAVHQVFHSEHNRLVAHVKDVALASNDVAFLNEWLRVDVASMPATPGDIAALQWDGQRLFQAARFGAEMQYQHLVFEEFARTVQPQVDAFNPGQSYDTTLDPAIYAEFAHVVYRFGHSMLTETVDRYDPNFNVVDADPLHAGQTGSGHQLGLIAAFLNPLAFAASGDDASEAAGAIVRGMTRQVANEIDEFVTEALRSNLVGLPLDLAAVNIARGRDTGVPTLNETREQLFTMTGDAQLKPYTSWLDFAANLKHPESVVNFIAAYGTHSTITAADTLTEKRDAATAIVLGGAGAPGDRLTFLNGPAATTGLDSVDFWIGGLAEKQMPFGGLLGSTFNFVFESQMERLQNGDRFYYLERTAGLNFLTELEGNSFAKLIMANTDAKHLPADVFTTPRYTLEVDPTKQFNEGVLAGPDGILADDPQTLTDESADNLPGAVDPVGDAASLIPLVIRDNPDLPGADTNYLHYTGIEHVVLGGTDPGNAANPSGDDILISGDGDDTVYGDGGNDVLDGGNGNDTVLGGTGNDIITDSGGDDVLQGEDGNDAIQGGNGLNLILGGFGSDVIVSGEDASQVFGGGGNDFIFGSRGNAGVTGNEGDDWLERGNADGASGDNGDPFARDQVVGNDVYIGDNVVDIMNAEGGDDIMVGNGGQQDHYIGGSGFDWAVYKDSPNGVTVFAELLFENEATALGANPSTLDRFQSIEGVSGSQHDDFLFGANQIASFYATSGATGSILTNFDLISGLRTLVNSFEPGASAFTGEILLGGAGSDVIKGGWGDEIIDADAWLNVQIGVFADASHVGQPLEVFNSILEIQPEIFKGELDIATLGIVREIRHTPLDADDEEPAAGVEYDTVTFDGNRAEYLIDNLVVNNNGTPGNLTDDIVRVVRVTHVGGLDGIDVIHNAERLTFADETVILNPNVLNSAPQGSLTISDITPSEGQALTVSIAGVTDADNITLENPTGQISAGVTYYWQSKAPGGVFTDVLLNDGVVTRPATGTSFVPGDTEAGHVLRVRAVYTDANGIVETVYSAPTAAVGAVNDPHTGTVFINDTTATQDQALVAVVNLNDLDLGIPANVGEIATPVAYDYQWQRSLDGGSTWNDIAGATTAGYVPTSADVYDALTNPNTLLRVRVSYEDGQGFQEEAFSQPTTRIGRHLDGNAAPNVLEAATPYQDWLQGFGSNDVLRGLAGDDRLEGGAGADTIEGGAGTDTVFGEDGNDLLDGGSGNDLLDGGLGDDTYIVGEALDAITDAGGVDTVRSLIPWTLAVGLENLTLLGDAALGVGNTGDNVIVGNAAANTLSGMGGADALSGGEGNDTLFGGAGDDILAGELGSDSLRGEAGNDVLRGGTGLDTAWFAGARSAYTITRSGLSTTVAGPDGTDTLFDIERLRFDDATVALSRVTNDLNADGRGDIVWRGPSPDGRVATWLVQAGNSHAKLADGPVGLNFGIVDSRGDYNGDGRSDILWRSTDGTIATWLMNGDGTHGLGVRTPTASNWTLVNGHGDYNGDGKSDLLWRGPNGEVTSWSIDGATRTAVTPHGAVPLNWQILDTQGDYNADGRNDILWRSSDGTIATWLMNGDGTHGFGLRTPTASNWALLNGHADYNGDGKSDLLWRGPNGEVTSWLIDGSTRTAATPHGAVPLNWQIVDTQGDYNADGRNDILWRSSDGTIATWLMNGTGAHGLGVRNAMPANWTLISGHADFDADGKSDLLWRGPNGEVTTWVIDGSTLAAVTPRDTIPLNWQIVDTHGDYNGDGKSDVLWRNTEGLISTWLMNGTGAHTIGVRNPMPAGWTLLDGHGDYNGDGKSDLLWRGPNGEVRSWLIDGSSITGDPTYDTVPLNWNIAEEPGAALMGDAGANVLTGTVAANLLRGLGGADTLIGNGGGDRFVFDTALDGTTNVDTVRDFRSGQDKLLLSDVIFSNLAPGPLTAANLVAGPGAQPLDADDRILYDTATGSVSYDADGNGAAAAFAFATLFGAPSLAATDIIVGVV